MCTPRAASLSAVLGPTPGKVLTGVRHKTVALPGSAGAGGFFRAGVLLIFLTGAGGSRVASPAQIRSPCATTRLRSWRPRSSKRSSPPRNFASCDSQGSGAGPASINASVASRSLVPSPSSMMPANCSAAAERTSARNRLSGSPRLNPDSRR